MARQGDREAANREIAEHVERTRRRLAEGRVELDRMHRSMRETSDHLGEMRAWIDETERHLRQARRAAEPDRDAAA